MTHPWLPGVRFTLILAAGSVALVVGTMLGVAVAAIVMVRAATPPPGQA